MPRASCVLVALCLVAASGSFCLVATSSVVAKQKPSVASKDKSSAAHNKDKKHKSATVRKKHKVTARKKDKPAVATREEPIAVPKPRTPVDKQDCIAGAQAFYAKAQALARRASQTITKEFQQVLSKLDEFCGEEEFEKARSSFDWMNLCLQNFTKDNKAEFCSRNAVYFCAIDQSDTCVTSEAHAD